MDPPLSRDHSITEELLVRQSELGGAVRHETIELPKRPLIQQEIQTLTCGEFALFVLCSYAGLATAELGLGT